MPDFTFRCSYIIGKDGSIQSFTKNDINELIKSVIEPMAQDGLRTIGLAYKEFVTEGDF